MGNTNSHGNGHVPTMFRDSHHEFSKIINHTPGTFTEPVPPSNSEAFVKDQGSQRQAAEEKDPHWDPVKTVDNDLKKGLGFSSFPQNPTLRAALDRAKNSVPTGGTRMAKEVASPPPSPDSSPLQGDTIDRKTYEQGINEMFGMAKSPQYEADSSGMADTGGRDRKPTSKAVPPSHPAPPESIKVDKSLSDTGGREKKTDGATKLSTLTTPAQKPEKKPEDKKPEEKKLEGKKPEEKKPEEKKPEAKKPEDKKLEATKPDDKKPEEKKPEEKKPIAAPTNSTTPNGNKNNTAGPSPAPSKASNATKLPDQKSQSPTNGTRSSDNKDGSNKPAEIKSLDKQETPSGKSETRPVIDDTSKPTNPSTSSSPSPSTSKSESKDTKPAEVVSKDTESTKREEPRANNATSHS